MSELTRAGKAKRLAIAGVITGALTYCFHEGAKFEQEHDFLLTETLSPDNGMTRIAIADRHPILPMGNAHFVFNDKKTGEPKSFDAQHTTITAIPAIEESKPSNP